MHNGYESLSAASRSYGERNDCAVIAMAIVAGLDYSVAHRVAAEHGRVKGQGMWTDDYLKALSSIGYRTTRVPVRSKTMASVERELRTKVPGHKFLVRVSGHVAGFDGQAIQDWARGSRRRIKSVWLVTAMDPES